MVKPLFVFHFSLKKGTPQYMTLFRHPEHREKAFLVVFYAFFMGLRTYILIEVFLYNGIFYWVVQIYFSLVMLR
jgi:hypothetical protein